MNQIQKPIKRGKLRQVLGKEYFILKRKFQWYFGKEKYAYKTENNFHHSVFKHQSMVLRPLKDVEMYLQENKRTNLEIAIAKIDEVVIRPGETFSIWKMVGRPTKLKGYLEGLVLNNGKIDKDTGGGLCQLGNLLFWIFAHSPLTITERYRHGFDVFPDVNRKVPFGAGATLAYNYVDLQVRNDTENSFVIRLKLNPTHLVGELLSESKIEAKYLVEERNHLIKTQYWGGYSRHNEIFQVIETKEGIEEKKIVENHAIMMYEPFLEE